MTTSSERRHICADIWLGARDPRANFAFKGAWMVADAETWDRLDNEPDYRFADAGEGDCQWCLVSDDRNWLEQQSREWLE